MDISATVRTVRRAAGLSQRELAARLGLSVSAVAAWESGTRTPSLTVLERLLRIQGLTLTARQPDEEPPTAVIRHLCLPLTARLRLALGEPAHPFSPVSGQAWHELQALAPLGRVVVQPPVAIGVWIPVPPSAYVAVTVHQPTREVPKLSCVLTTTSAEPPAPSLVPITVSGPDRVWVFPPAELLATERRQLRQAAAALHGTRARDDGGRRAPAHRDPDEWVEAARMLVTKGTEGMVRPVPALGRAWRLTGPVSLTQRVRRDSASWRPRGG